MPYEVKYCFINSVLVFSSGSQNIRREENEAVCNFQTSSANVYDAISNKSDSFTCRSERSRILAWESLRSAI